SDTDVCRYSRGLSGATYRSSPTLPGPSRGQKPMSALVAGASPGLLLESRRYSRGLPADR
ncbi:MAG: hypothetical protein N0C91_19340, partial [Candidatus Thiodiazotropha endolucinida]|nr:hypothetical protein [Candidatus Thiodiazotropha taylori]MCW4289857.1 hypothetical protein [Candidatus Thiodiazotropha endolucinida]